MQLEPIAARRHLRKKRYARAEAEAPKCLRIHKSLAVEPIELVAERQGGCCTDEKQLFEHCFRDAGGGPREGPIRYGEVRP